MVMKILIVAFALCAILTISQAGLTHPTTTRTTPRVTTRTTPRITTRTTTHTTPRITTRTTPRITTRTTTHTTPRTTTPDKSSCAYQNKHCSNLIGAFCPQCDASGNFRPQQCSGSTGSCWCVNTKTGKEIPNTKTGPGVTPVNCKVY